MNRLLLDHLGQTLQAKWVPKSILVVHHTWNRSSSESFTFTFRAFGGEPLCTHETGGSVALPQVLPVVIWSMNCLKLGFQDSTQIPLFT